MSTITNDIEVLDQTLAIQLEVTQWTARTKLTAEDLGLDPAAVPDSDLASLGSKRICPQEQLRIFSALKSRAVAFLDRNGVRLLSGWIIPLDKTTNVTAGLDEIKSEFDSEKSKFIAEYDKLISDWLMDNPSWREVVKNSLASSEHVANRLNFNWYSYKINTSSAQNQAFTDAATTLSNQLFSEISSDAEVAWRDIFANKNAVTHKALGPLRRIRDKLQGFRFMDYRVTPCVALLESCLDTLPARGNLCGASLDRIHSVLALLRNKDLLVHHAARWADQHPASDDMLQSVLMPHDSSSPTDRIASCGLW